MQQTNHKLSKVLRNQKKETFITKEVFVIKIIPVVIQGNSELCGFAKVFTQNKHCDNFSVYNNSIVMMSRTLSTNVFMPFRQQKLS